MRRTIFTWLVCVGLCGCSGFGPTRLDADQLGYSRALSDSEKQVTLLNIIRLRYGDTPAFLDTTQVISGYQLQRSVSGSIEAFPSASGSTFLGAGGSAQLQESPTFTLQPVTGDHFAQSFLRPLSPSELLPMVLAGLPVDVLFRLAVQSVGSLENATGLEENNGEGSPDFFKLTHDLRRLQVAGLISIRLVQDHGLGPDNKPVMVRPHAYVAFAPTGDPVLRATRAEVHRLLGIPPDLNEVEVVYGRLAPGSGKVAVLTRTMLSVLGQLAFQAAVPDADVIARRTLPSVGLTAMEPRPVVAIHAGPERPRDAFTAVRYGGTWFWIENDDFNSKVAFTMLNILLALATTSSPPGTVITIPAG